MSSQYNYILSSRPQPSVALITLHRPKALNALCSPLFAELNQALREADNDASVGAVVLTGSEKAFAGNPICDVQQTSFNSPHSWC
jgi:enoyl-CoA hydratase